MNKYELALVVNAKLEEEERAAVVEKAKGYVTRYGGTVGEVEEWGKKRLAYEIQHMREAYYYFIQFEADATAPVSYTHLETCRARSGGKTESGCDTEYRRAPSGGRKQSRV